MDIIKSNIKRLKKSIKKVYHAIPMEYPHTSYEQLAPSAKSINIIEREERPPYLNILLPSLNKEHLTGGPNTAINFACHLKKHNIPVRFIAINTPLTTNKDFLMDHCSKLSGLSNEALDGVEFTSALNTPLVVSPRCQFLATAWWTAKSISNYLEASDNKKFYYFIQDYEPGFYEWGHEHALALETYSMNYTPIVNSESLYNHMLQQKYNSFQSREDTYFFKPAVDSERFHPNSFKEKTLLFYARPSVAPRNLFHIGLEALYQTTKKVDLSDWSLYFIGESLRPVRLHNCTIRSLPWMDYQGYSELVRKAKVTLSLMLSPHPSYLPLESASAGSYVVTNTYGTKSDNYLKGISNRILPATTKVESIKSRLIEAIESSSIDSPQQFSLPSSWEVAFQETSSVIASKMKKDLAQ